MEISIDKLLQIIGSLHVELLMIRTEIERLKAEIEKNKPTDTVTPLRPSSA